MITSTATTAITIPAIAPPDRLAVLDCKLLADVGSGDTDVDTDDVDDEAVVIELDDVVDADVDAIAEVDADVDVDASAVVDADVDVDASAEVDADVDVDAIAEVEVDADAEVEVEVDADVDDVDDAEAVDAEVEDVFDAAVVVNEAAHVEGEIVAILLLEQLSAQTYSTIFVYSTCTAHQLQGAVQLLQFVIVPQMLLLEQPARVVISSFDKIQVSFPVLHNPSATHHLHPLA